MTSGSNVSSRAAAQARDATPCPVDQQPKAAGHYLCRNCWFALSADARRALNRRDRLAGMRLLELHRQIQQDVPLAEIQVTP